MEGIQLPPEEDIEKLSLPPETERASRGSDGPPDLQDVADGFATPSAEQPDDGQAARENGTFEGGDSLSAGGGSGEDSGPINNGAVANEDTNVNLNGFKGLIESMINNNEDSAPNSQRTQSEIYTERSGDGTAKKRGSVAQSDSREKYSADDIVETRPRLLIMDLSGEGAVYSLRIDLVREKLVVGKTVEPEYWRPIRALRDYAVVVFKNELYVIGGFSLEDRKCSSNVTKLNPATNVWTAIEPINVARCKFAAEVVAGKIFIAGGERSDGKATASCEIYDPDVGQWSKAGMLPAPRKSHACAVDGHHMFLSGGMMGKVAARNMWIFENYGWHELDNDYPQELNHGLERHLMVFHDNTLYFAGGMQHKGGSDTDSTVSSESQCINQVLAFKSTVLASRKDHSQDMICPWTWKLQDMPTPRHSAGYFFIGHKLFVVGGRRTERDAGNKDIDCYDTKTDTWSTWFTMPNNMFKSCTCAIMEFPPKKKQEAMRWDRAQSAATSDSSGNPDVYNIVKRWVFW